ncbi:MAG: hypothetical protein ACE5JZ_01445 [Kiloniellales bacterium]
MPVKSLYQDRKRKDLEELEARIAEIAAKIEPQDGEAADLLDKLRDRYRDAENAFARLEAAGEDWEELMDSVDAAFRNVYLNLQRMAQRLE